MKRILHENILIILSLNGFADKHENFESSSIVNVPEDFDNPLFG